MEENIYHPLFAPEYITRSTFSQLLSCYPIAIKEGYKRKIKAVAAKLNRKGRRPEIPEAQFDRETEAFLKLNTWRYDELPPLLKKRIGTTTTEGLKTNEKIEGMFLHKDELIKLMEWKLKHGHYRPGLAGMIETNQAANVRKTTAAGYAAVAEVDPSDSVDEAFPKASLDILTGPLRAVGPATASLILAACTEGNENDIPYYSDEVYFWLCLYTYPGKRDPRPNRKAEKRIQDTGVLNVKYNLHEYRDLFESVYNLRVRLNATDEDEDDKTDDGRKFTNSDIEKVAVVLKNLAVSGFPDVSGILEGDAKFKQGQQAGEEEEEILGVTPTNRKRKADGSKNEKFAKKGKRW